jgi:hypothetical protein
MPLYGFTAEGIGWLPAGDSPWAAYGAGKRAEALGLGEDDEPDDDTS